MMKQSEILFAGKKVLAMFLLSGSLVFADNNSIGLDTVVGATLGVAIGNQIGGGNGRDVARIAGGILGATIANSTRNTPPQTYYYNNTYGSPNVGYTTVPYVNNNYYVDPYYAQPRPQVNIVYNPFPRLIVPIGGYYRPYYRSHRYVGPSRWNHGGFRGSHYNNRGSHRGYHRR
jgi:hypothetical protein